MPDKHQPADQEHTVGSADQQAPAQGQQAPARTAPAWLLWQRMTRVLGVMAQVGLAQIGRSPPPKADLHQPRLPYRQRS